MLFYGVWHVIFMAKRGSWFFFCGLKGGPKNFCDKYFLHQAPLTSVCERSLNTGQNKIILSSGARFHPIDFLNVTDPNRVFLNPVKQTLTLTYESIWGIMGYDTCFTWKDCFKVKYDLVWLKWKVIQLTMANMRARDMIRLS